MPGNLTLENLKAAVAAGEGMPVVILNRNEPTFYCVPAAVYEAMLERIEIVGSGRGGELRLPITGVFHFDDAGKITLWRDYWDTSMAPSH